MMPHTLKLAKHSKLWKISRFPENFQEISRKKSRKVWNLIFWVQNQFQWLKSSGNDAPYMEIGEKSKFRRISRFPEYFRKKSRKMGNLKFWVQNQVLWPKLSGKNTLNIEIGQKLVNFWEFPDFQISNIQIPEKLEIGNSELKIKASELNWKGKIPNILILAKTSQFPGVSRFPDSQFPNSRNFQMPPKLAKNYC